MFSSIMCIEKLTGAGKEENVHVGKSGRKRVVSLGPSNEAYSVRPRGVFRGHWQRSPGLQRSLPPESERQELRQDWH